jgi:hypothetical protein
MAGLVSLNEVAHTPALPFSNQRPGWHGMMPLPFPRLANGTRFRLNQSRWRASYPPPRTCGSTFIQAVEPKAIQPLPPSPESNED